MQVYELAIELGVRSADLVVRAEQQGIGHLGPTDALTAQQASALRSAHGADADDRSPTDPAPNPGPGAGRRGPSSTLLARALLVLVVGATVTMFAWLAINDEPPEQADAAESGAVEEVEEVELSRGDICAAWDRFEVRNDAAADYLVDAVTLQQVVSELEASKASLNEAYRQLRPFTESEDRASLEAAYELEDRWLADAVGASSLKELRAVLNDPARNGQRQEKWSDLRTRFEDC